jgi:hypothetical protein
MEEVGNLRSLSLSVSLSVPPSGVLFLLVTFDFSTHPLMNKEIVAYNEGQAEEDKAICHRLAALIEEGLPEAAGKVWHAHPVWFLADNPVVGYSKQKAGIRLMFWSGADFEEEALNVRGKKFKDASRFFTSIEAIDPAALTRWLQKARTIQWDYRNLVKRKGRLEKIEG